MRRYTYRVAQKSKLLQNDQKIVNGIRFMRQSKA